MKKFALIFTLSSLIYNLAHAQIFKRSLSQYDQVTGTSQGQRVRSAISSLDYILDILSSTGDEERVQNTLTSARYMSPEEIANVLHKYWQAKDAVEEERLLRILVDVTLSNERVLKLLKRYSVDVGQFHPQVAERSQLVLKALNQLSQQGGYHCAWIFGR